jgi:hypothetical protein
MPSYIVTAPDGKEYDVDAPEGATEEQALDYFKSQWGNQQKEELPSRTAGDVAKDIATTAAKGVIGVDQAIVGIADLLPGVNAGKFLEEHGVDFNKMQKQLSDPEYGYFSPQQQEANKSWGEANTLGEHVTSLMEHPSGALSAAGEAFPAMLAGGVGGKAVGKLAGIESALARGSIGEAGITAGQGAEEIRSQSPDKELDAKGKLSALGQGAVTGALSRVGGSLTEKLGGFDPDTLLTGGLRRAVTNEIGEEAAKNPGMVQRTIASIVGEGLFEEAPQSAQETMWTNYALDRPLLQGVDTAAIKGGILGSIVGGGAAVMGGKPEEAVKPEDQPAQEEVSGPLNVSRELKNVGISRNEHRKLFESLTGIDYSTPEGIAEAEGIISKRENIKGRHGLPAEFNNDAWNAFISNAKTQAGVEETTDETPPPPPPPENEEEDEVPPSPESKGTVKNKTISATYEQVGTHEDGTALYNATYTHKDGRTWTKENVPLKEATTLKLPPELLKPKKAEAAPIVETTPVVDEQEEEEEDITPPPPPPSPPVVDEQEEEEEDITPPPPPPPPPVVDEQEEEEEDITPPPPPPPPPVVEEETPTPPPVVEEEDNTPTPEVGRTVVANDFQEQQTEDEKEQALFDAFLNIRQKSSEKTPEQEAYTGRTQLDVDEEISALNFQKEESLDPDEQKELSDKIRALRTEKKTLPRLSVAPEGVNTNHTVESLQPHLTPEMKRLVESGKLTLHDSMDTLPGEGHPENVQGLTTPQGEVHLVASKLTPETLPKVAMHEVGVHVGMRGMVGDKVWGDLTSQALTTKGEVFDRARQAVPANTPAHLKGEETLAYLVENAPKLPIVRRIISAVKNWVRTTFGAKLSITESDIHHLAAKALHKESKTSVRSPREGTAYARELGQLDLVDFIQEVANAPRKNSRIGMAHEQVLERVPELTESATKMMDMLYDNGMLVRGTKGNLAKGVSSKDVENFAKSNPEFRKLAEAHDTLVEEYKPVEPYKTLPTPATENEMREALAASKVSKIYQYIPDGYKIKLRLDIPAYKNNGVWVVTAHEGNTQKNSMFDVKEDTPIGYFGHAVADNPKFSIEEAGALRIADKTRDKYPLATVDGEYVNMSAQEAKRLADEAMTNPDWVQVGMDPERHSYFYDRKTMQPIKSGSRVIQIGSILMVKDPVYGKKSEYVYSFTPQGQASQAATEARKQGHPKTAAKAPLTIGENIQKAADKIETSISSYDARYINTLRNQLTKMVKGSQITWDQMRDFLMRVSQSQTMHSTSTAGEAALRGGMKKSSATRMWEGVDSADNMPRIRQLISDIATKYGETFEETSKRFGEFMVAARIDEIYRAADNIKATAQTISGPARHAYLRKTRKILDLAKNLHMSKAEVATHLAAFNSMPEFREPMEMWHRVRKNVIDTLVASGRYSPEQASNYMDAVAYVPFNRIMDVQDPDEMYAQMANGNFRKSGSLMAGQTEHKIKGSKTREVDDIILNMEKWVVNSYVKAIRADKSRELVDVAEDVLPQGSVTELDKNGPTAIVCYRNGVKEYWEFKDPLMRFAFNGVSPVPRSALSMGVKLATFLRNCIVYNPLFTLSQLPQDTYTAMYTSGVKRPLMLPFEVLKEFVGTAFSTTKAHERLKRIGAVGQKDFADQFGVSIHDLAYGGHHAGKRSALGKIKDMAEHFAMAGDNAVRQAIYNRTMKEMKGRPEAEAIAQERAFEVINFRRRGASAGLDSIRQITPFLGAYIQANRAAYNAISGRGIAPSERKAALATMAGTTIQMMAMLWLYNALADHGDDDDEFKNKDSREKDTHIFPLRALGVKSNITLPIRADVFALPFVTGNHAYTYLMNEGTENPELAKEAMKAAVVAAFMNAPVGPTIIKPILEVSINHDFFTGRSVVPQRLVGADKEYQYKSDTSEFSKLLGKTGFISPISADHLIKGFAGYTGAAALATIDYGLRQGMDIPYADKSGADAFRSIPGMPSLLGKAHSDESQDVFYKLREEQEKAFRSYNMLKGEKRFEEARAYKEENRDMLNKGTHTALNHIITKVDALNRKKRIIMAIPNDSMSPADKRAQLDSIEERILNLERKSKALYNRVHP